MGEKVLTFEELKTVAIAERFLRNEYLVGKTKDDSPSDYQKIHRSRRRGKTAALICSRLREILKL